MKEYNTLDDFELTNKTILLRVDFNLPLDKTTLDILDTTRIKLVLPTIQELVDKRAKIVILAHQGRSGSWDFTSMDKHANALQDLLNHPVLFINDIYQDTAQQAITGMQPGEIIFLDNVRKFPQETEKKTAEEHAQSDLVQHLLPYIDLYVNDAFAAAHRAQCSLIGFTPVVSSCAGRLMEKELTTLETIMKNPQQPSIFLFGGAKFSDVIITIERLLQNKTADIILLTGLPANAFLKAQGYHLGEQNETTLLEEGTSEQFGDIKTLLSRYTDQIKLPVDFAIDQDGHRQELSLSSLPTSKNLFDIGEETINNYSKILETAGTIFLSGPCGVFENPLFQKGTQRIFTTIAHANAFSLVGGGHTVAAVEQLNLRDKMSHISTGGGSLEKFMMGEKLVVVEALKKAKNNPLVKS